MHIPAVLGTLCGQAVSLTACMSDVPATAPHQDTAATVAATVETSPTAVPVSTPAASPRPTVELTPPLIAETTPTTNATTPTPIPTLAPLRAPTAPHPTPAYPYRVIQGRTIEIHEAATCASGLAAKEQCDGLLPEPTAECVDQTKEALTLLRTQYPAYYDYANRYIGAILCLEGGSGMKMTWTPPTFKVGLLTRDGLSGSWYGHDGGKWYAGAIVHDACHSAQYWDWTVANPGKTVPHEVYFSGAAETECGQIQADLLAAMGVRGAIVAHIRRDRTETWTPPSPDRKH